MAPLRDFQDLRVWQEARVIALAVYRCTAAPPFSRDWGLRDQAQRAGVSVMANIAEGFARYSPAEFRRYLIMARASVAELRSHLSLAEGLGYLSADEYRTNERHCAALYRT
jgi:four helix bundle protein